MLKFINILGKSNKFIKKWLLRFYWIPQKYEWKNLSQFGENNPKDLIKLIKLD